MKPGKAEYECSKDCGNREAKAESVLLRRLVMEKRNRK